jgi:hypothetical protein
MSRSPVKGVKEYYKIPVRLIVLDVNSEMKQARESDLGKLNKNRTCSSFATLLNKHATID